MPTVAMNVPERKAPSLNWSRKQVFPTPESPSNITCKMGAGRGVSRTGRGQHPWVLLSPPFPGPLSPSVSFPGTGPVGSGEPREKWEWDGTPGGAAKRCPRAAEQPPGTGEGESRRGELVGRQVPQQEEMSPGRLPAREAPGEPATTPRHVEPPPPTLCPWPGCAEPKG